MSDAPARIDPVRVGIVDIGSNTARLLVADVRSDGNVATVAKRRAYLGLGEEIAVTGTLSTETIHRTAVIAAAYAERARREGAAILETIITAPGRQGASATALVGALREATGVPTLTLSADDEGRLAYEGAIHASASPLPEVVGVVDVGGGSTEIVVGTPSLGAAWIRSLDLGSLRLTRQHLGSDPPGKKELAAARGAVRRAFADLGHPVPDLVLATGGSAKAVWRVLGRTFDPAGLDEVIGIASSLSAAKIAKTYGHHPHRARTLLAGALILQEAAHALGRPLELAEAGLREGAALALAWPEALAA
jgi:exopolyphosphatase/guanosine-5'-triphosphate,3'-diphosphate pyrophosphatase